jgi:hypothetical protein
MSVAGSAAAAQQVDYAHGFELGGREERFLDLRVSLKEILWRVGVPLSQLLEESVNIAWVYLDSSGELGNGAARFLTDTIEGMIRRGQRNRMFLANMAIMKYRESISNVVPIREHA